MKNNGIYDNWKYSKNQCKYGSRAHSVSLQSQVANDVKRKLKQADIKHNFDKGIFVKGRNWCEEGFTLDDAPENMKNHPSFVAGFEKGKRLKLINQQLYELGREYYQNNTVFDDIPDKYKTSEFFMKGYNDCKKTFK